MASLASGCAGTITVAAAGDLQLGAERTIDPLGALPRLLPGDLRLANLEGPLTDRAPRMGGLRVHGRAAQAGWLRGRFDAVALANNHIDDCGPEGVRETLAALREAGVAALTAEHATLLERRGQRLALFARSYAPDDPLRDPTLVDDVRARARRSMVIVSLHWGHTGLVLPSEEQRAFARKLVEAGARLVVGHGPHTPMGVEKMKGPRGEALVAYSLGNLSFDCDCTDVEDAYTIEASFDRRGELVAAKLHPLRAGLRRAVVPSNEPGLLELLTTLSADLGTRLSREGDALAVRVSPRD